MIGHRLMGTSLLITGDISEGRGYFDQAIAPYDAAEHRPLATQFGQDLGVNILSLRSWALWSLGYPKAALADTENALKNAREISQAATLMYALVHAFWATFWSGNYDAASKLLEAALADKKGASFWKALIMIFRSCLSAMTRETANATQMITSGITAWRSTGSTIFIPLCFAIFGSSTCGTSASRKSTAEHWRSAQCGRNNQRKMVRGGHIPDRRRTHALIAGAGSGKS